ncbi:protein kinase [Chloroflexales bacterium ZM16-3]|nr:protein kinase [Chloroflexales bacterium ZM16-3]
MLINHILGNYRLDRQLGAGGMGEVYLGVNPLTGRQVAVKVLSAQLAASQELRDRFLREARSLDRLDHPNIVRSYDCGLDPASGRLYLVMELASGGSLRGLLAGYQQRGRALPLAEVVDLAAQAARGLAYAHRRGVVHRDIKPDNLLLQPGEAPGDAPTLKIGDFGLARLQHGVGAYVTRPGSLWVTLEYAAPEQLSGGPLDHRCDIYALGGVLFELLIGQTAFSIPPGDLPAAIHAHLHTPPPSPRPLRPDIPPALEAIVLRCLAKSPADRYADDAELATALATSLTPDRPTVIGGWPMVPPTELLNSHAQGQLLRVIAPDGSASSLSLPATGITVGREPNNALVLDDPKVSRQHLWVGWATGGVLLADLGSSNGTKLDGAQLQRNERRPWPYGGEAQVGPFRLRLVAPPAPGAPPELQITRVARQSAPRAPLPPGATTESE